MTCFPSFHRPATISIQFISFSNVTALFYRIKYIDRREEEREQDVRATDSCRNDELTIGIIDYAITYLFIVLSVGKIHLSRDVIRKNNVLINRVRFSER